MRRIDIVPPKNFSGFNPRSGKAIPVLKKHQYHIVEDFSISGDAPKDLLRLYEYGEARKANVGKWPLYIAKVGHKWYPNESITEYLLNRLGECLGFTMAGSKLAVVGKQIRFLTKYFLKGDQQLIHGAEIYADYLSDKEFVEEVENQSQAQDFFTVQFTKDAIKKVFPEQGGAIFTSFVKMLAFDAIVGNNDRHFYNWGVVKDIKSRQNPVFSPIYDTARGLYWNENEGKIVSLYKTLDKNRTNSYINRAKPKIGWEGRKNLNHFDLVNLIAANEHRIRGNLISEYLSDDRLEACKQMIHHEFSQLISKERKEVIIQCLQQRHEKLVEIVKTYDK